MQANHFVTLAFAAILLQGCNQTDPAAKAQTDAAKIQADVAKAGADGQKKIIDAQAKLDQVVAQNNKDLVGVQADAQKAAISNPNAPTAAASADIAKAHTSAEIKVADAQYDVDKAKAEAAEQLTDARCQSQLADANKTCVANAKSSYEAALAIAKTKNDAAHATRQ